MSIFAQRSSLWLGGALLLMAPALWNGFALLQYDTGGYLARIYEGYLVPSRPGAYGVLLYLGVPTAFWSVLLLQATLVIWTLKLLLREMGLGDRPRFALAVIATLCLLTTLPLLVSILLTDIFAGLMVLALYLIAFGPTLSRREKGCLTALVAVSGATHSATFGVLLALVCGGVAVSALRPQLIAHRRAALLLVSMAAALITMLAANFAVSSRVEFTPGSYGILFGRILQSGIAMRYLNEHCPDTRLRLCAHRDEIPQNADAFLWGNSVFNRLGRFNGLGDEMRTIVLESLRAYPAAQAKAALAATAEQLVRVRSGEGVINRIWHTYAIIERYTPSLVPAMRAARQQHNQVGFQAINRVHVPVGLLATMLLFLILLGGGDAQTAPARTLAAVILLALLVNAAVCGALANPHDRYGARLIWLAPLAVIIAAVSLYRSSTTNRLRALLEWGPKPEAPR